MLIEPVGDVVLLAGQRIEAERLDQVAVRSDVFDRVE